MQARTSAVALLAALGLVLSLFALAKPALAEHTDAHLTEKFVTAVNGVAVTDPNRGAGAGFVEVETGDQVTFTINIRGQEASTQVAVSDVFKKNQFAFVSSTGGTCALGADAGADSKVECTVTTNAEGAATLALTFTVIATGSSGEGCPTITNTAHVAGGGDNLSDQAQVKVCGDGEQALNIVKTDDDGRPLAGVAFTLTPQGGTAVTLTTNAQGAISFGDVGSGTFTLTEAVPTGCVGIGTLTLTIATNGAITVTALPANVTINGSTLNVVNTCGSALNVVKVNQAGAALSGVSFTLTAAGAESGTTVATNAQGMVTFADLDPGNFTLTEAAPAGCTGIGSIGLAIAANGNVTVTPANASVEVTENTLRITNNCPPPPTATLSILKVDASAAAATRGGAVFTLTRADFNATATTVAAGTASFTGLTAGDFVLTETTPPTGCTGISGSVTIRVAADGTVSTVGTLPAGVTFTSGTGTLRVVNDCPVRTGTLPGNPTTGVGPTTPVVRGGTLGTTGGPGGVPNTAMLPEPAPVMPMLAGVALLLSSGALALARCREGAVRR